MTERLLGGSPMRAHAARFGAELARAMHERGVSNRRLRLAARIGSTSNVSEWRNGHNMPGIDAAQRMADALAWPRLAEIAREARTRPCSRCGQAMVVDAGRPRRYCSAACRDLAAAMRSGGRPDGTAEARAMLLGEVLRTGPARKQVIGRAVTIIEGSRAAEIANAGAVVALREAVAAMCRGCVVDDLCRTPECPLRPVSPLPLSTDDREADRATPSPGRWADPRAREGQSARLRARWAEPGAREALSERSRARWAAMSPEERSAVGRRIRAGRRSVPA